MTESIKTYIPFLLIYSESFETEAEVIQRENIQNSSGEYEMIGNTSDGYNQKMQTNN